MKTKKYFCAILATLFMFSFASTSAFAESGGGAIDENEDNPITIFGGKQVGGGTWEYGTKQTGILWWTKKTVWSNYWHPTKTHGSSAQLGANTPNRSCVAKDKTAGASQTSSNTKLTGYAYWNTTCTR